MMLFRLRKTKAGYWLLNKEYDQINYEPYRNKICKVFFYRIAIFAVANEKLKDNIIRDHTFCFRILCNKIWYAVRERRSFTGFGQW